MDDFSFNWRGEGPITVPVFETPEMRKEKEERKAAIRKRIIEIDNQLASHGQYVTAAEAARVGNLSPYMQLLSQQQNTAQSLKSAATGITNELYNAEKFIPALGGTDEERRAAEGAIRTAMNKAVELGGESVRENPSYKRLEKALEGDPEDTIKARATSLMNDIDSAIRTKDVVDDALYDELSTIAAEHPEAEYTAKINDFLTRVKGKRESTRAAYKRDEEEARNLYNSIRWSGNKDEQSRRVEALPDREYNLLKRFYPKFVKGE